MSTSFENKGFNQFNRKLLLKEGEMEKWFFVFQMNS